METDHQPVTLLYQSAKEIGQTLYKKVLNTYIVCKALFLLSIYRPVFIYIISDNGGQAEFLWKIWSYQLKS